MPAVFVLIPSPYVIDKAAFRSEVAGFGFDAGDLDPDQPTRLMRTALTDRKLTVVDALPAFREAAKHGGPLYGLVDRHLTPRGTPSAGRARHSSGIASLGAANPAIAARDPR